MSKGKVDFVHPGGGSAAAGAAVGAPEGVTAEAEAARGGGGGTAGGGVAHPEEERLHRVRVMERQMAVGFSGGVPGGLACSPSGDKAFYPLGNSVVVRHLGGGGGGVGGAKMTFLTGGHTHPISCLHLSEATGAFLATGEEHQIGTKVTGRPDGVGNFATFVASVVIAIVASCSRRSCFYCSTSPIDA